jgi:antitoxin (DNA-binding transcriptional repressor) of toxin-antitoxin stability system
MSDYGPIPISRLKDEGNNLFDALANGRRVLISRHGRVVAAIEPASVDRHTHQLAAFAVRAADAPNEVTATDLNQGSPSEAVREAEQGRPSLLTRNRQVAGILQSYEPSLTAREVVAQERQLAEFERSHPDATTEELVAEAARISDNTAAAEPMAGKPIFAFAGHIVPSSASSELLDEVVATTSDLDRRIVSDAMLIHGLALEQAEDLRTAVQVFEQLVTRFEQETDAYVLTRVARSKVELARLLTLDDRPREALNWTSQVMQGVNGLGWLAVRHDRDDDAEAPSNPVVA